MPKIRGGFTIIEIVLFIAISGFLIVGLMVGTSATVARQRYNDSVQDLAEFFRREFSAVVNPENSRPNDDVIDSAACKNADDTSSVSGTTEGEGGRGRSGCLLYGRLITIGEEIDGEISQNLFSYEIIGRELGKDYTSSSGGIKADLAAANINALVRSDPEHPATCTYQTVGTHPYSPQWLAAAQRSEDSSPLRASILIIRSPVNGSVYTLVRRSDNAADDAAVQVQNAVNEPCFTAPTASTLLTSLLDEDFVEARFEFSDLDLCVGSDDIFAIDGRRRKIRIHKNAHNSSAVELIDQDDDREENQCQ